MMVDDMRDAQRRPWDATDYELHAGVLAEFLERDDWRRQELLFRYLFASYMENHQERRRLAAQLQAHSSHERKED